MENLSLNISSSSSSRDLLQRFMVSPSDLGPKEDENEEVELNLGLSLGGRFGVDRTTNKLMRSSSVATYLPVPRDDSTDAGGSQAPPPPAPPAPAHPGLARTSSLPVESEEEWRKRKEMQSLRRMEAKRRRSEKQRNMKSEKAAGGGGGGSSSVEDRREVESSLAIWAAMAKGKESCLGRQGSFDSIDLESKALQGPSGELSPGSIQSLPEGSNQETGSPAARPARPDMEGPSKTPKNRGGPEIGISALEDMPCVFTSPNGRRVDGILYRYGKGEEVRIMCVCHGTFHSPGGFVKHAGGPDVDNPLKHIVVNPNGPPMM
ncbi:ninja-family protein afp1 [Phtheirospermum japonicum]|uniref:Ninja-family protein n=1 Tax=Phtheirospermum japonicum TaxID=374723 RepID=A0A830D9L4_9LAMI|nr:ninja-family protein afp1 [Phtheirospermum japonicum]